MGNAAFFFPVASQAFVLLLFMLVLCVSYTRGGYTQSEKEILDFSGWVYLIVPSSTAHIPKL